MFRSLAILVMLLYVGPEISLAQENHFATLFNLKSRPLAMGGAFTSVEDDLESIGFNPGTFSLYKNPKDFRITFFFNSAAPFVAYKYKSNDQDNFNKKLDAWEAAAFLVKAFVVTGKFINVGFIFGEESTDNIHHHYTQKWLNYNDIWDNSTSTFFISLKLAERLSLGVSGILYHTREDDVLKQGIGYSYGILLKPNNKLNVGLSYMDFPDNTSEAHSYLMRHGDETMNIGLSLKPISSMIFSVDVRNLTEENKNNVREFHIGFEQSLFKIAAIRLGYYRERFTSYKNYSFGVGLIDTNLFFRDRNQFDHNDFLFNYGFVYKEGIVNFERWHFFSFIFRI